MNYLIINKEGIAKYNRSLIMKDGWKLKSQGNPEGIKEIWRIAREQMQNFKELAEKAASDRFMYRLTYSDFKNQLESRCTREVDRIIFVSRLMRLKNPDIMQLAMRDRAYDMEEYKIFREVA